MDHTAWCGDKRVVYNIKKDGDMDFSGYQDYQNLLYKSDGKIISGQLNSRVKSIKNLFLCYR